MKFFAPFILLLLLTACAHQGQLATVIERPSTALAAPAMPNTANTTATVPAVSAPPGRYKIGENYSLDEVSSEEKADQPSKNKIAEENIPANNPPPFQGKTGEIYSLADVSPQNTEESEEKAAEPAFTDIVSSTSSSTRGLSDAQQGHLANLRLNYMDAPVYAAFEWEPRQFVLSPAQMQELDRPFLEIPNGSRAEVILIECRTDKKGPVTINEELAGQRVQAIVEYLKKKGAEFAPDFQSIEAPYNNHRDAYLLLRVKDKSARQ